MARSTLVILLGFVVFLFFVPGNLRAQIAQGSIGGFVTDPGDAVVVGATAIATNVAMGIVSNTITTSAGYYEFPLLPAGTYKVTVEQQGFQQGTTAAIVLHAGDKLRIDMKLVLGQTTQSVEVVGTAPLVNATTSDLGTVIESRQIGELPLNGRTFTQILTLQPGWNRDNNAANRGGVSLNGLSGLGNNWLLDGVDMSFGENNGVGGGAAGYGGYLITYLSVDAIQELKATTGSQSAEYGRVTGGTINLTTKSGTDHFHGTAWEYLRNDKLNTSSFFANKNNLTKPSLRQNEFGGNLGGPILRNRLFFFFNYEGARVRRGVIVSGNVPTQALYNQMTNSQLVAFFKKWEPAPTSSTSDPLTGFYARSGAQAITENTFLARLDANLGKHHLSFRMVYNNQNSINPQISPGLVSGYPLPSRNYLGSWTYTITPTMVNEIRVGSNSNPVMRHLYALDTSLDKDIPGVGLFTLDPAFPGIAFSGPNFDVDPQDNLAADAPTKTIADDLTWVHGAHTVKTGLSLRYTHANRVQYGQGIWYVYDTTEQIINDQVQHFELDLGNPGKTPIPFWTYGAYIQDNWKVNRRLTLNLGMHYDYFQPLSGPIGFATTDPYGPQTPLGTPLWHPRKKDFSPRLGLVYNLTADGKTVLRAGAGTYYGAAQPFYIFDGNWISPTIPAFPFVNVTDLSGLNTAFPHLNWNFLENIRNNPSSFTLNLHAGRKAPNPDHKDEYSEQWNVSVERELTPSILASVSYVGNRSIHILSSYTPNLIDPATGVRPHADIGPITWIDYAGRLWSKQLQVFVRKKTSHGLAFDAFYTYGTNYQYRGADTNTNAVDNYTQDLNNANGSIGPADGEKRHRFSGDYIWAIPTGRWVKSSGFARAVLDGWSLAGIMGKASGGAQNIVTGRDAVGNGRPGGQRPDVVPGVSPYMSWPNPDLQFYNRAAWDAATTLREKRFGNAPYGPVHGPGSFTWDMGIRKSWQLHENHQLAFRLEMFNWLNHVVFSLPGGYQASLANATFGRITSGSNGREMQVALRYSF
jgi:hypothetical protein